MVKFNSWHLIYTRPNWERKISAALTEIDVNFFFPTQKTNAGNRLSRRDVPLFPSYIFVYLKTLQEYYRSLSLAGVLYYVKIGRENATVSDSIINSIKMAIDSGNELVVSNRSFQPGQSLTIRQGPLSGLNGEIVQWEGRRKVLVRVKLLQRNVLVSLPENSFVQNAC